MGPYTPAPDTSTWSPATLAIHADDHLATGLDVAPPIHTSTTFGELIHRPPFLDILHIVVHSAPVLTVSPLEYPSDPNTLLPLAEHPTHPDLYIYSRHAAPSSTRLESVLSTLLHAPSVTYSSGLSAIFAAYTLLNPKHVSITGGYHGSFGVLGLHTRLSGLKLLPLDCAAEELGPGDVIHLETPVNPTGECRDIASFAKKAHDRGAFLLVDATFGPPGLQDPFKWGADIVMHSGTKYLGGHSDMLCGVLATNNAEWYKQLLADRLFLGSVMGSLEGWLGVRSVRTLELRVRAQSANAEALVRWIYSSLNSSSSEDDAEDVRKVVAGITHASVQSAEDLVWIKRQMPGGFGPVFAVSMKSVEMARRLPSKLRLFHHATSLGGVESLVEWRAMTDTTVDKTLLRFSIGIERWEDLREDLLSAFRETAREGV